MTTTDLIPRIAYVIGVTSAELLASRGYTYMPGACISCGAVYEDVHHDRAGECDGCETATVWPWTAVADGRAPSMVAVRQTCYRAPARLEAVS